MPDPFPLTTLADFADDVTVVPFHPRRAQWLKDRVKPLNVVTHRHSAVSVVTYNTCNMWSSVAAVMGRCWPEPGLTE